MAAIFERLSSSSTCLTVEAYAINSSIVTEPGVKVDISLNVAPICFG